MNHNRVGLLFILLVTLSGCSDGTMDKAELTGTILYDGQPIPRGNIRFIPINNTKGPTSGATITDGKYHVMNKGGVPLGEHKVTVTAFRKIANMPEHLKAEGGLKQYLPQKHHKKSQLKVTITEDKETWVQDFKLVK